MSNFFFFLIFFSHSVLASDLKTFCFQSGRDLQKAKEEIQALFLDTDKAIPRTSSPCMEVISNSSLRLELFEKFLSKRFKLETENSFIETTNSLNDNCKIHFIETKKKNIKENLVAIGKDSRVKQTMDDLKNTTTQVLLVQPNRSLVFQTEKLKLDLVCKRLNESNFEITLTSSGQSGGVSTVLTLSRGVKVSLATSLNDLNNKKKQLGYPESEWLNVEGNESINYELFIP